MTEHATLSDFLRRGGAALARGPVALLMAEDDIGLSETLRHHAERGFARIVLLAPEDQPLTLPASLPRDVPLDLIRHETRHPDALVTVANALIPHLAGQWLYCGYTAEFLFHPFCETRTIGEMLAFAAEERREAVLCFVIDLYAGDLATAPDAFDPGDAWMDRVGYHALARPDPENHNFPKLRQLDFYGGLRWRFEEHIPETRRRIDRAALFRARKGLQLTPDFRLTDEEMNTYASPWHSSLTAVVASFRTAKALRRNPGSGKSIHSFRWENAVRFDWSSRQLMDMGLMEPGQWF